MQTRPDALSRLPVPHEDSGVDTEVDVFALQQIDLLPITATHLKKGNRKR